MYPRKIIVPYRFLTGISILSLFLLVTACSKNFKFGENSSGLVDHATFDALLKKYVDSSGNVDYQGLKENITELDSYLEKLSDQPPGSLQTREEKLAYWINAYNAFTLKLIADNYPLESIKDLNATISIPMVNSIWEKKFFTIGNREMSLGNIEHDILREEFNEPRIHFAIVCASASCPALAREAYTAQNLEKQLSRQARQFLSDPFRNEISRESIAISAIFRWFRGDFTENSSLIGFLNQYTETPVSPDAEISYKDYDWSLNEQK